MKIKNKFGEDSHLGAILWLIGIVATIFVLFIFLNRANLGKETEQDICHYSVVARSTAISIVNPLKTVVPLNCKTQYVCISKDGTCDKLISPQIKKVEDKKEVYNVLANQLANCWRMFGEGKVDYTGKELSAGKNYCSLCYQVAFDKSIKEMLKTDTIDKGDFYNYLEDTKIPEKDISYWDYLFESNSPQELANSLNAEKKDNTVAVNLYCKERCRIVNDKDSPFCTTNVFLIKDKSQVIGTCNALSLSEKKYGIDPCPEVKCLTSSKSIYDSSIVSSTDSIVNREFNLAEVQNICQITCDDTMPEIRNTFCSTSHTLTTPDSKITGTCYAFSKDSQYGVNDCKIDNENSICPVGTSSYLTNTPKSMPFDFGTIDLTKRYYVIMGITSETSSWIAPIVGGAGVIGVIASGFFTGGISWIALGAVAVGTGGTFIAQLIDSENGQKFLHPTIIEASEDYDKLQCSDVNTLA